MAVITISTAVAMTLLKSIIIGGTGVLGGAGIIELVKWAKKEVEQNNHQIAEREENLDELLQKTEDLINQYLDQVRSKGYENTRLPIGEMIDKGIGRDERTEHDQRVQNLANENAEKANTDSIIAEMQNNLNNQNDNDNEIKDPIINPGIPNIDDKTDENITEEIAPQTDWKAWWEEQQAKLWEREDAIRKETQEREDTAWQRGVEDMRKAGINPNLINASPAESGGGITQASQMNTGVISEDMSGAVKELQQLLEQNFKGTENDKDRWMDALGNLISTLIMAWAVKK